VVERKRPSIASKLKVDASAPAVDDVAVPAVDDAAAIPDAVVDGVSIDVPVSAETSLLVSATTDSEAMYSRRHTGVSRTPEPPSMLTDDRLLDMKEKLEAPIGWYQRAIYELTFHTVNLGDSRRARARKVLISRITTPFNGDTRYVPILTRKGGVGKTTTTTLLGMALAQHREDRVIAIDANPDRGTLAERIPRETKNTIRSVVAKAPSIGSFTDFTEFISRDVTRLHVLASDPDPTLADAFDEYDYNVVADVASRYYSLILTDCGTGIVHSVMKPILSRANSLVIVSGGSIDEARLASETLSWLESNGYADVVRNSVVALNTATQGTMLVKLDEIENHFRSRVREVVRIPYDSHIAAGSVITWSKLNKITRDAAEMLAAFVVEGMPSTE
jgi:MinD-like ATPase involved in chromosome partitioning or flagellar assembly